MERNTTANVGFVPVNQALLQCCLNFSGDLPLIDFAFHVIF
jgi:hypothetical protein